MFTIGDSPSLRYNKHSKQLSCVPYVCCVVVLYTDIMQFSERATLSVSQRRKFRAATDRCAGCWLRSNRASISLRKYLHRIPTLCVVEVMRDFCSRSLVGNCSNLCLWCNKAPIIASERDSRGWFRFRLASHALPRLERVPNASAGMAAAADYSCV